VAKINFLPYEKANQVIKELNIKSESEWRVYSKRTLKPADIPATPDYFYLNKGWKNWGEWLGTGRVADQKKVFRSFSKARQFTRKQKLKSEAEWRVFTKSNVFPEDIPSAPSSAKAYKKEWVSFPDWLGTDYVANRLRKYKSFGDAKKYAKSLNLNSGADWSELSVKKKLPPDLPSHANEIYKEEWKGWGDFLGTGNIGKGEYLPFNKARRIVRKQKIKNQKEWILWKQRPNDIPSKPERIYKDNGWKGLGDWLGTGRIADQYKIWRKFSDARKYIRSLELKNSDELSKLSKKRLLPDDIPSNPRRVYKNDGWMGMGDWLGNGQRPGNIEYKSFEEARKFARSLKFSRYKQWREFTKTKDFPNDIPKVPYEFYKKKGYKDSGDWFGSELHPSSRRNFRTYKEARKFIKSLKLKSNQEWRDYLKSGKKPIDIPSAPEGVYKDKGWIGWNDFLGNKK
jgi:hypothetical protein